MDLTSSAAVHLAADAPQDAVEQLRMAVDAAERPAASPRTTDLAQVQTIPDNPISWTRKGTTKLQEAVNHIFGSTIRSILDLEFSVTIADPGLVDCPLVGCSEGFTTLTGHKMEDIVGRNCRFLVDPVPPERIDRDMRRLARDFCQAVASGREFKTPEDQLQPWMPKDRPHDEVLLMQTNSHKDGTLFQNLFYMKKFSISYGMEEEKSYIVGLQSELPNGLEDLKTVAENLDRLDANLTRVTLILASWSCTRVSMARQLRCTPWAVPALRKNKRLTAAFPSQDIQPWEEGRFTFVKKLADAPRNKGSVILMQDMHNSQLYAVKHMPNSWVQDCHEEFLRVYPQEIELPWVDIGCTRFLNSANYKYACQLSGVYRNEKDTFVVSEYANGGDLFDTCQQGGPPGPKRESTLLPMVIMLCQALHHLHDKEIVHRDISLENIVQTSGEDGKPLIKLIDYGMASSERYFQNCVRGKSYYQAPEMHNTNLEYDAFLVDIFAAGVVVFAVLLKDYPWKSTKPAQDKAFEYARAKGLATCFQKRYIRGTKITLAERMSKSLIQLLVGLLAVDPTSRLTLGEEHPANRKSLWDEPWIKGANRGGQTS